MLYFISSWISLFHYLTYFILYQFNSLPKVEPFIFWSPLCNFYRIGKGLTKYYLDNHYYCQHCVQSLIHVNSFYYWSVTHTSNLQTVTFNSCINFILSSKVIIPVENINNQITQWKNHPRNNILSKIVLKNRKENLEILSIFDTELRGSSGSFIALVIHLKNKIIFCILRLISTIFFLTFYIYKQAFLPQRQTVYLH